MGILSSLGSFFSFKKITHRDIAWNAIWDNKSKFTSYNDDVDNYDWYDRMWIHYLIRLVRECFFGSRYSIPILFYFFFSFIRLLFIFVRSSF